MTESERIRATLDALVRAANAPTTDEDFRWDQEAQRIWNAPHPFILDYEGGMKCALCGVKASLHD